MSRPFAPGAATVNINVAASSARVKITNASGVQQVRVMNNGTATVWIAFGDSTVTATTAASMPIGPGASEKFTLNGPWNDSIYAAAIAAGATGIVYFTPGADGV